MHTRTALLALLAAVVEARFGQEQGNGAIAAIAALSNLGSSGQAATLAGGSIQFLLAAANPCGKLTQADAIIAELGTSKAAVAAARGLVAAEQNFNPFVVSIPFICADPTLPKSPELRGVVPLIDPAVTGENVENANSKTSVTTPFNANGLSVAQVMLAHGFSNFTAVMLDGTNMPSAKLVAPHVAAPAAAVHTTVAAGQKGCPPAKTVFVTVTVAASASKHTSKSASKPASKPASNPAPKPAAGTCTGSGNTLACTSPGVGAGAVKNAKTGNFDGFVASTIAGLDFGRCVPTIKFEAGLDGRATTAFTFQAIDPLVNQGQEEALNPNIITNRIHDQLTNVCGANQAAKNAAAAAQAKIASLGTRDVTTANAWNTALGFAGTNTNPDNAPVAGLVGHT